MVSTERLSRYETTERSTLDTLTNYMWNISLSEALYPCLCTLEVTLRNSIHNALAQATGEEMWFDQVLLDRERQYFRRTYLDLRRRVRSTPSPGMLVAELNFGFWVSLLTQPYHQRLWAPDRARLLHIAFPYLPPTPNARRFIHHRLNVARVLRNRVMHHEPVLWGVRWGRSILELETLHSEILESIGWMSPSVRDSMDLCDRFLDVNWNMRRQIESGLAERFGVGS